jgi:hypothetical protein
MTARRLKRFAKAMALRWNAARSAGTQEDAARYAYVKGEIEVDELEWRLAVALKAAEDDDSCA